MPVTDKDGTSMTTAHSTRGAARLEQQETRGPPRLPLSIHRISLGLPNRSIIAEAPVAVPGLAERGRAAEACTGRQVRALALRISP